jgi:hypothetical protein
VGGADADAWRAVVVVMRVKGILVGLVLSAVLWWALWQALKAMPLPMPW